MKLTIDRDRLAELVRAALPAVAGRTTMPALKSLLIRAADDRVTVSATDNEIAVDATGVCETPQMGVCLVDAATFDATVKHAPAGPLTLATTGERVVVKCKGSEWKLPTRPADEFPVNTPPEGGRATTLTAGVLTTLLSRVVFAAKKDQSEKYVTSCVQLEVVGNELWAAATDTRRIAVASVRLDSAPEPGAVLIPSKSVGAILSAFTQPDEPVKVTLWRAMAGFETERVKLRTALVAGNFPDWRKFEERITPRFTTLYDHPRQFLQAVKRAAVTADVGDGCGALIISATGAVLTLSVAGQKGDGEVEHTCSRHEGREETVEGKWMPDNLADFLSVASGMGVEEVALSLEASTKKQAKAALFTVGSDWKYFVMPQVESK